MRFWKFTFLALLLLQAWACEQGGSGKGRRGGGDRSTSSDDGSDGGNDGPGLEVEKKPTAGLKYQSTAGVAIRNFREINYSFASLTGVALASPAVRTTFAEVKANLPSSHTPDGFSPAGQAGMLKLATTYCNQLMANDEYADRRGLLLDGREPSSTLDGSDVDDMVESITKVMVPTASDDQKSILKEFAAGFSADGATVKTTATGICIVILANSSVLFY